MMHHSAAFRWKSNRRTAQVTPSRSNRGEALMPTILSCDSRLNTSTSTTFDRIAYLQDTFIALSDTFPFTNETARR